ncbi:MAG TPA: 16S rRNA (cytidine(1402)-2'-O)-methyltransferase [Nannocystaceae bacterium]|nr:16S rRNA (cytidine(1402)-2'-O)-methyltransferase [Nannocystaceae bacterium]
MLLIVGTPLGNREDLSPRARAAILGADVLFCEDTRSPVRLLGDGHELPPRRSCFVGNEHERTRELLALLEDGKRVAFLSEAGMPCWSDPGQLLVRAAIDAGHAVDVIPGPTAVATAVCHSGLPSEEVRFCGFPPRSGGARSEWLASLVGETATTVCYEAGNRVAGLLDDLARALPDAATRKVVIARELTKLHQETIRGTVEELRVKIDDALLGEVSVVLAPAAIARGELAQQHAARVLEVVLDASKKPREKARLLAELTGLPARELYARLGHREPDEEVP